MSRTIARDNTIPPAMTACNMRKARNQPALGARSVPSVASKNIPNAASTTGRRP